MMSPQLRSLIWLEWQRRRWELLLAMLPTFLMFAMALLLTDQR